MLFTPDTQDNIAFLVDLANTHPTASRSGADELSDTAELDELLTRHGYTGRIDSDAAELAEVLRARDEVRALWSLPLEAQVDEINRWLDAGKLKPNIARELPLSETAAAHRLQEDNTVRKAGTLAGKIVLTP